MNKAVDLLDKIRKNHHFKRFMSSRYAVSLSVLLVITLSVLTLSHVLNYVDVQASLMEAHELSTRSFQVFFDGKHIGDVRTQEEVDQIVEEVTRSIQKRTNSEIAMCNTIQLIPSHTEDEDLTSYSEILNYIRAQIEYNIIAYGIQVDGEIIGVLECMDEAESILQDIQEPYLEMLQNNDIIDLTFAENVEIVRVEVSSVQVDEYDQLLAFLQKGTTEEKTHTVEQGESLWGIAHRYQLTVEELMAANPSERPELIHPGDELSLIVPKPYISVVTVELAVLEERIPFETEYEYVSWMFNDEFSTKRAGVNGVRQVEAYIIRQNGIEVERQELSEEIIKEPVARIMYNGTKEPPPKKGTGTFVNPLPSGRLTSRYGARWGGFHYGIDLAARSGTAIRAADGGDVIYAGWFGDYGYMVEIDHGGGFTTRYAHCSQIYVSVGEKVYQGKVIAAVGNTGFSTGPHLHFEVRKYGSTVNPESFIGTRYR